MAVIPHIGAAVKIFSKKPLEITSKVLGAAVMTSVLYDAHINAKERAKVLDIVNTADRYEQNYKQYMHLEKRSQTIADLKNLWFGMQRSFSWVHLYSKAAGYIEGAFKTLWSNIPEIALSIAAVKSGKYKTLGKAAGIVLAADTAKTLLYDTAGIGTGK